MTENEGTPLTDMVAGAFAASQERIADLERKLRTAEAERAKSEKKAEHWFDECLKSDVARKKAEADLSALRKLLSKYARHTEACGVPSAECSCGYEAMKDSGWSALPDEQAIAQEIKP